MESPVSEDLDNTTIDDSLMKNLLFSSASEPNFSEDNPIPKLNF